jgi:hypothetical protein
MFQLASIYNKQLNDINKVKASNNSNIIKISDIKPILTLTTAWYIVKSKFDVTTYIEWIKNFIQMITNFNLVIYTDNASLKVLIPLIQNNKCIKVIIKPFSEFITYKYKSDWIDNHKSSTIDLHKKIEWKLNMLWNEKVFLVKETIDEKYFDTEYYGWCDIGYFRNGLNDIPSNFLNKSNWPNNKYLRNTLNDNKIHYGCVQNNTNKLKNIQEGIINHYNNYKNGKIMKTKGPLLIQHYYEISIAGGFFIGKPEILNTYVDLYKEKLEYYFKNKYFIKDDQIIILDIITLNPDKFYLHKEDNILYNNWFMFQRILL